MFGFGEFTRQTKLSNDLTKIVKPKLILYLALVLSGGLFGHSVIAQSSVKPDQWQPFPILPPITNANPAIHCTISIRVPTKLKIERMSDMLSETIDTNSFESTNLIVGTNMVTGVEGKIYVYPEGESRPANGGDSLSSGLDFNLGLRYWHTKQDGIPVPGKKYVVEIDLAIFETDIPPQHHWEPYGKNYRVLWRRTLKQTVE